MSLSYSIASNNFNGIKNKLDNNPSLINEIDNYGRPNLYYAIAYGDLKMLKLLLSYQPDLSVKDIFGLTCVDYAYLYDKHNSTNYSKYIKDIHDIHYNIQDIHDKLNKLFNNDSFIGTLHLKNEDN